ncbi:hypothetical protein ACLOJK_002921 [Asimina triloba]
MEVGGVEGIENHIVGEAAVEVWRDGRELSWKGEGTTAEPSNANWLAKGGVGDPNVKFERWRNGKAEEFDVGIERQSRRRRAIRLPSLARGGVAGDERSRGDLGGIGGGRELIFAEDAIERVAGNQTRSLLVSM